MNRKPKVVLAGLLLMALCPVLAHAADDVAGLPAGSTLRIRLITTLSTRTTQTGDPWMGKVVEPIFGHGQELIPAGSTVEGRVTYIRQPGRVKGSAEMRIVAESIVTPEAVKYTILANLEDTQGAEGAKVKGEEGTIQGPGKNTKDAATQTAAGAGVGAGVGAITAGGTGALYGAGMGVVAGVIRSLAQRHKDILLHQGTELTFVLARGATPNKTAEAAKDVP